MAMKPTNREYATQTSTRTRAVSIDLHAVREAGGTVEQNENHLTMIFPTTDIQLFNTAIFDHYRSQGVTDGDIESVMYEAERSLTFASMRRFFR